MFREPYADTFQFVDPLATQMADSCAMLESKEGIDDPDIDVALTRMQNIVESVAAVAETTPQIWVRFDNSYNDRAKELSLHEQQERIAVSREPYAETHKFLRPLAIVMAESQQQLETGSGNIDVALDRIKKVSVSVAALARSGDQIWGKFNNLYRYRADQLGLNARELPSLTGSHATASFEGDSPILQN